MKYVGMVMLVVLLVGGMVVGFTAPPTPSEIGASVMGANASVLGMGGAGVALANDPYAPYWNPAGLADLKGFHMPFSISARLLNIDTVEDWADLVDILDKDYPTLDDFNKARDIAKKASGKAVVGEISPYFALAGNRFAFSVYGTGIGKGVLNYTDGATEEDVSASLAGYYLIHRCLSVAGGKGNLLWGVNVDAIKGKYSPYERALTHDKVTGTVTTTPNPYTDVEDSALNIDVGILLLQKSGTRVGAVIRHLNSPSLFSGTNNLELKRDMDIGIARIYPRGTLSAQWSSIFTKGRIDAGGEVRWGILALRLGVLDGKPIWGVGLGKGYFRLDLAYGPAKERVALNFSLF